MISSRERIMLVNDIDTDNNSDGNNDLDDLYKGYNEFHPVLDTRNLQEDEDFRQTVNKSGYGRSSQSVHRLRTGATNSTAGLAFQRSQHGLKSRRTAASRDTAGGLRTGLGTGVSRPATAVRGAGYTSQSNQNRLFDPLGLAQGSTSATGISSRSAFHLHDESTPEWKIKQMEKQINFLLDESVLFATKEKDFGQALDLAKDCVAKERSLNRLKEQSGLMETYGPNSDLTFATMFNLAERYSDAQMWSESINTYQAILKNRSFTNTGRLRMNIGEIYFRQRQYPKAIKFFRMALDQIPNTYNELRLKLMHNIGLAFVRLTQFADAIAAFEFILAERGDWDDAETVFHLIICYYALGDGDKMKYYFNKLLQVKIEDQFEERYGHHEILTNGGTIFVSGGGDSTGNSSTPVTISRISSQDRPSTSMNQHHHRSTSPVLMVHDEQDHYNNLLIEAIKNDRLRQYEKDIISKVEWSILTSAKLIAPYIEVYDHQSAMQTGMIMMIPSLDTKIQQQILNNGDFNNGQLSVFGGAGGYDWCLDQIRRMATITATSTSFSFVSGLNFHHLADELELYKAVKQLRCREFDQAILTLKSFERKDRLLSSRAESGGRSPTRQSSTITNSIVPTPTGLSRLSSASVRVTSTAATNLSFLYLLQNDYESARRYADEAIAIDRYCLGAILNKGNIYYNQGDFQRAIEHYQEVIANNSTILEAYFNLALAERKLSNYDRALDALYRLRTIVRVPQHQQQQQLLQNNILNQKITNTMEVNLLYQIGLIYESMGNQDQAKDFYQKVLQLVPSDVTLLVKMADIEADDNDRKQSLHYLLEAYRYLPSHIPTIERLAAYYIEMKMYDQTIKYLEQLSIIQPNQIKWQLMIAASYRRSGNYQQALITYQSINQRFPDNTDCLKFLIRLCSEMEQEPGVTNNHNYGLLVEQYTEQLRRLEKTRELREEQKLTSSRSASRTPTAAGRASKNSSNSREGSAATISSNGSNGSGSSSGYMTSSMTPGTKSITPKSSPIGQKENLRSSSSSSLNGNNNKIMKDNQVSAIVDQVVEQLDSSIERPTTSWRNRNNANNNRNLKSSHGRQNNINNNTNDQTNASDNNGQEFYEDFLLDANIDEMLPD